MQITTYTEARAYLESFIRPTVFERFEGDSHLADPLERMRVLMALLGNPQESFISVQVSGTSGKGSTAYLLANIVTKAGYKTGFTLSPHLQNINERMQINLKEISDTALLALVNKIIPAVETMKNHPVGLPSYFELLTALAFLHFAEERVDLAVVEVGLEGKYDATNVLDPVILILTNISRDHTELLGNTEEDIAEEAFSVVRKGKSGKSPLVVTGVTQKALLRQLQAQASALEAKVLIQKEDFNASIKERTKAGILFSYDFGNDHFDELALSLRGEYQVSNASLAITAALALRSAGIVVTGVSVREGTASAFFPGRFEVINYRGKTVILDGAHNQAKMDAFLRSLAEYYPACRIVFIVGFKKNKDVQSMLSQLFQQNGEMYLFTQFHKTADYARSVSMTLEELRQHVSEVDSADQLLQRFTSAAPEALEKALQGSSDIVVVTGSLYLVGEIRGILEKTILSSA